MSLYDRLRQIRLEHELRQEDVSNYLGFRSKNGYWSLENGKANLKAEHLRRLMQLYKLPAEYFLGPDI